MADPSMDREVMSMAIELPWVRWRLHSLEDVADVIEPPFAAAPVGHVA